MPIRIGLMLLAVALTGCAPYHEPLPPPSAQTAPAKSTAPADSAMSAGSATPPRSDKAPAARHEGSVQLEWTVPTERTDGKALAGREIAAYRIYYGPISSEYSDRVEVPAHSPVRHTVRGLKPGKLYYFAVSAVDRDGREGPKSNEIRRLAR